MRRSVIAAGAVLALLSGAAQAQVSSGTSDPHVRELAQALVAEEGIQASWSNIAVHLETVIKSRIEEAFSVTDPAQMDRIGVVVHSGVEAMRDDLVEARVSALTQTFTAQELEGMLAFSHGPNGQAYQRAAPELTRAFMTGLGAQTVDGPEPSEQKLALINRLLKARDFENSARQVWRVFTAATATQAQEDAYAQLAVAAEVRFYANTFSDDQLTELAVYFEGPTGRAEVERGPQFGSVATSLASKFFERRFERVDEEACVVVACSAVQRAALDAQFAKFGSGMVAAMGAVGR